MATQDGGSLGFDSEQRRENGQALACGGIRAAIDRPGNNADGNAEARRRIIRVSPNYVSRHAEDMMVSLWLSGKNTCEIAKALGFYEHEVAGRLPSLRNRARQIRKN